ncbi:hypothetical protein RRG08_046472 [Elysia crispata]|uniref:Uncharacterized protein n=1 Tax=Elysia crispata TaxID=231223 RepID=A0AAE0YIF3_9GAST|nr:hypothetical protein RRG08_046472 [Elysia crispata]
MQERYLPVIQLAVHLENGQCVFFSEETAQDMAVADPPTSTFTAFFYLCRSDPFTSTLFHIDVPRFYTWKNKSWKRRNRGTRQEEDEMFEAAVIGRMYTVSPRQGEWFFFLRFLLHHGQVPRSKYGDVEAGQFAEHLLDLGSENFPVCKEPDSIFVGNFGSCVTTQELIDAIFPNFVNNLSDQFWSF